MIKQFSASFDQIQDRLLLRFNTTHGEEFRFWLTRRKVMELLETLPRNSEQSKEIISNIEKTAKLRKSKISEEIRKTGRSQENNEKDFVGKEKGSKENEKNPNTMPEFETGKAFPIGENAVLVKSTQCDLNRKVYNIQFFLENNTKVNFSLSLDTFLSLHSLLEMTANKAEWNIDNKDNPQYISKKLLN